MHTTSVDLTQEIVNRFALARAPLRKAYQENLQKQAYTEEDVLCFNPFIRKHIEKAEEVHLFFRQLAKMEPNEEKGIRTVLSAFDLLIGDAAHVSKANPDLLFYSLKLYSTGDANGAPEVGGFEG